jgi:hypothetical protein
MSLRPSHPQAPLTEEQRQFAASVQIAREQNVKNLDKAVLMIELRKWCVVQAVDAWRKDDTIIDGSVVALAGHILDFVSAPIQE